MHEKTQKKPKLAALHSEDDMLAYTHEHNCWEIVRTRGDLTTLRCRECQYLVKSRRVWKCDEFTSRRRCSGHGKCNTLHIYPQKMSLEERVSKHGTRVLEKVPAKLFR
eukprot:TRINITY_DN18849_c0_g1_i1.p1 TRINITY_DN18849_c0_g1~~TRINITY_DN18849_c0_g1_i1.p1  ORF type:complete len:125 (+),score=14.11 TRINITY_DN18849_c0_g1_i1:54-377(+)